MVWEALGKEGELKIAQRISAENLYIGWGALLMVWQRGLKDWLERWQPDVLIMEANPRNVSTNFAVRWMHSRHRPVIGWGLGAPAVGGPFSPFFARSRRGFLAQFDALVSYSRSGVEQYKTTGFPSARIFLAPNAATPRPTHPPAPRPAAYR
ncbi:MAG: glycosyltransferase, partial [Anaerolineaceae bacterium]|nr:glycosyltransferase [Anaerolineaceae bacterium]